MQHKDGGFPVSCVRSWPMIASLPIQRWTGSLVKEQDQLGPVYFVIVHTKFPLQPVILWIELGGKSKWLPLTFGYCDMMRTTPIKWCLWVVLLVYKTSVKCWSWHNCVTALIPCCITCLGRPLFLVFIWLWQGTGVVRSIMVDNIDFVTSASMWACLLFSNHTCALPTWGNCEKQRLS